MDVSNSDPFVGLSDEQVARLIDSAKILRTRIKRALFIKEVMTLLARQVTPGSERIRTISNGQLMLAIDDAMRRLDEDTQIAAGHASWKEVVMNKVWTAEDLKTLRTELMFKRDIRDVAATLDRPVSEVEEIARDLGWIEAPPLTPE